MSGLPLVDLLALAGSLFNALLLVWLGLTVLLNAERRTWGVLLAAAGLLVGGVFFLGHSVLLIQGAASLIGQFGFWWGAGWLPLIAAPLSWYLLMLWYGGFWDTRANALRRRQTFWLYLSLVAAAVLLGLILTADLLPITSSAASYEAGWSLTSGTTPAILLLYPLYILLCVGLSLDALLRPAPPARPMGELARRRARPWLAGACAGLLTVSLLVGVFFVYLAAPSRSAGVPELVRLQAPTLAVFDLVLTLLISAVVLLVGQAIVSYEIFTGRSLPRRGFIRQWRLTLTLTAVLSVLASLGLTSGVQPGFSLVAVLVLVTASYALFGWQIYNERVASIRQLRPLSANQHLFESIISPPPGSPAGLNLDEPFRALCEDILEARKAFLLPLGALSALGVPPLRYPAETIVPQVDLQSLAEEFSSGQLQEEPAAGHPLDPAAGGGFVWATPLWNERGLGGILLLGEKSGGAIYSMEEIELARTSGERLIDLLASAELARRLIALQRQRMAESGLQDQRARRVLHDDILPQLHTAILQLSHGAVPRRDENREAADLLASAHKEISDLLHDLPALASPDVAKMGLETSLRRVVEQELKGSFDRVEWVVGPEAGRHGRELPPLVGEVVYFAAREALRNAARHARPEGSPAGLEVSIRMDWVDGLRLQVEDNGVGIPPAGLGIPTDGHGLSLHGAMMAVIHGSLSIESALGEYTRVVIDLPGSALEAWE